MPAGAVEPAENKQGTQNFIMTVSMVQANLTRAKYDKRLTNARLIQSFLKKLGSLFFKNGKISLMPQISDFNNIQVVPFVTRDDVGEHPYTELTATGGATMSTKHRAAGTRAR